MVVSVDGVAAPRTDRRVVVALDGETVASVLDAVHRLTTDLDDGHLGRGLVGQPTVAILVGDLDLSEPDGLAVAAGDDIK